MMKLLTFLIGKITTKISFKLGNKSFTFSRLCTVLLSRFVNEEHHLEFEVETGMMDGMEHKFHSEGEPHMDGEPGDLILKIRTYPHDRKISPFIKCIPRN